MKLHAAPATALEATIYLLQGVSWLPRNIRQRGAVVEQHVIYKIVQGNSLTLTPWTPQGFRQCSEAATSLAQA